MKIIHKPIKKKELLALPNRNWNEKSIYDYLYLVPTGKKHDSGYSLIAIVGVILNDKNLNAEIAATCDDINWYLENHPYNRPSQFYRGYAGLRTDCEYPSGIMKVWGSAEHYFDTKFEVGESLSSTNVIMKVFMK